MTTHTAYRDQFQAAVTHAHRLLDDLADHSGAHTGATRDPWITRQLARLTTTIRNGQIRTCPHITHAPRVLHAAVWAPGHLVCTRCATTLAPDATEDTTCDRCRQPADPIHPAAVTHGPLILAFGLCTPCTRHTK
jgi:hypothetical protein